MEGMFKSTSSFESSDQRGTASPFCGKTSLKPWGDELLCWACMFSRLHDGLALAHTLSCIGLFIRCHGPFSSEQFFCSYFTFAFPILIWLLVSGFPMVSNAFIFGLACSIILLCIAMGLMKERLNWNLFDGKLTSLDHQPVVGAVIEIQRHIHTNPPLHIRRHSGIHRHTHVSLFLYLQKKKLDRAQSQRANFAFASWCGPYLSCIFFLAPTEGSRCKAVLNKNRKVRPAEALGFAAPHALVAARRELLEFCSTGLPWLKYRSYGVSLLPAATSTIRIRIVNLIWWLSLFYTFLLLRQALTSRHRKRQRRASGDRLLNTLKHTSIEAWKDMPVASAAAEAAAQEAAAGFESGCALDQNLR